MPTDLLYAACQSGQVEVVKLLLERGKIFIVLCILMPCFCGAGAQTSSVDVTHLTALHHACMASAAGCVRQLLAQPGIELDSQDLSGCTALLYCLKNRNSDLEKVLHLCMAMHLCYKSTTTFPSALGESWSKSNSCPGLWFLRPLLPYCSRQP